MNSQHQQQRPSSHSAAPQSHGCPVPQGQLLPPPPSLHLSLAQRTYAQPASGPGTLPAIFPTFSSYDQAVHTQFLESRNAWLASALTGAEVARQYFEAHNAKLLQMLDEQRLVEIRLRGELDDARDTLRLMHEAEWTRDERLTEERRRSEELAVERDAAVEKARHLEARLELLEMEKAELESVAPPPLKRPLSNGPSSGPPSKRERTAFAAESLEVSPGPFQAAAEEVGEVQGEDEGEISMAPAYFIPRELNFDVKTLTSPIHFFALRRIQYHQ